MPKQAYLTAYPFLKDTNTLQTDFEILTDEVTSLIGVALHHVKHIPELKWFMEYTYHLNGSLRGACAINQTEVETVTQMYQMYDEILKDTSKHFVLPQGSIGACHLQILRVKFKEVVRMLYKINNTEKPVNQTLLDFTNVSSNLFFLFALYENKMEKCQEVHFVSKSYL